ncbi:MAG: D-glycero-beta-D-manno-heptose-7-phosphate kinase [Vicingaceae bacterium]|nr:D-glycero-beta-D-manno-heptose-7-phosphate kinase [Vicingaceae bacterium]
MNKKQTLTKTALNQLFKDFNNLNVLIIGDVMIDAYYFGKVDRISPEAPVPIVAVEKKEKRLGGAANVALNIQALGANPILCSVIGQDEDGGVFENLLKKASLSTEGILKVNTRVTTVKTRIIGNKHQLLRVDSETDVNLLEVETNSLFQQIKKLITSKKIDVVVFEDYDKGVITKALIKNVVELCNEKNIPTTVDPKKRNFLDYNNVTLFKPNLKELKEGLNIEIDAKKISEIKKAIQLLNKSLNSMITLITLSENGIYSYSKNHQFHIPAHIRTIADVSGAGDTVISVASLCLALKQDEETIAKIANLAGGLVCEKVGVVPIDKKILLSESLIKLI